jgi:anti-sigma regulatory factor (Ser/Thr protein kinase)
MAQNSLWAHETVLAAEAVSVARAREFVRRHLLVHDQPDLVEDVRLVVSELATNAMLHARTPFTVTLQGTDDSVLLSVRDASATVPVQVTADVLDTSGRGLSIVDLVSRDWGVMAGGTGAKSVWAVFDARTREPTPW